MTSSDDDRPRGEVSVYVDQELLTRAKGAVMLDEGREVTDELADATGTTPEEIERGAEDVDMAPPVERCGSCEAQEMIANAN